jgi:hypothetical protein
MKINTRAGRVIVSFALAAALILTGLPNLGSGAGVDAAYADVTSGGAAVAVDIATATAEAIEPQGYTGKSLKPIPVVSVGGVPLEPDVHFSLSYQNNKLPGAATVTIKGKSAAGYIGELTVPFSIILSAPTELQAEVTGDTLKSVTVSWTKPAGVTGYKLYLARNSSFSKEKKIAALEGADATSYVIDHPYYKRNYYFKVRAYATIDGEDYYSEFTEVQKFATKDLKWIVVDLSQQKTYCKIGKKNKKTYLISSGKRATPTIKGTFYIYLKRPIHTMVGIDPKTGEELYRQPDVKWISYFEGGYAFHATYWHSNFGHRMSHGCVNMRTKEAKWLYKWAPMGTKVVVKQ